MLIIEVIVNPLFYSIRIPETYQVAESYILPPPTTIAGAIIYSYAIWTKKNFTDALMDITSDSWFFAVPLGELTSTHVVLRRNRFLQVKDNIRNKKKFYSKLPEEVRVLFNSEADIPYSKVEFASMLRDHGLLDYYYDYYSKTFTDALYRNYIFTNEIYIAALLPLNEKFYPAFTRIGDTESLVTVKKVSIIEENDIKVNYVEKGEEIETKTFTFLKYNGEAIIEPLNGGLIQQFVRLNALIDREKKGEKFNYTEYLEPALLPLTKEIRKVKRKKMVIYTPTLLKVRTVKGVRVLTYKSKLLGEKMRVIIPSEAKINE